MTIEEIIDKLGDKFDEVRRNIGEATHGRFTCYLMNGKRFNGSTFREAINNAYEEYKKTNS